MTEPNNISDIVHLIFDEIVDNPEKYERYKHAITEFNKANINELALMIFSEDEKPVRCNFYIYHNHKSISDYEVIRYMSFNKAFNHIYQGAVTTIEYVEVIDRLTKLYVNSVVEKLLALYEDIITEPMTDEEFQHMTESLEESFGNIQRDPETNDIVNWFGGFKYTANLNYGSEGATSIVMKVTAPVKPWKGQKFIEKLMDIGLETTDSFFSIPLYTSYYPKGLFDFCNIEEMPILFPLFQVENENTFLPSKIAKFTELIKYGESLQFYSTGNELALLVKELLRSISPEPYKNVFITLSLWKSPINQLQEYNQFTIIVRIL